MSTAAITVHQFSQAWKRVEEHYGAACRFGRQAVEEAWLCGDALIAAKAETKHGGWLPALKVAGITPDTAQRMMSLRRTYTEIPQLAVFDSVFAALKDPQRPRSGNATHDNDDEWYTPPEIIEVCRTAMGGIDLDPASYEVANRCVKATRFFTAEENGLEQPWEGRVFLNPPYSKRAGKAEFIAKLAESYTGGGVTAATVVLSYDFSASWFEPLRGRYAAICLCRGRVQFYKETPGDGHDPALGTSLVYLGPDVGRFAQAVSELGDVVIPYGY